MSDALYARLDKAIERGEITEREARDEWLAAEEEAIERERGEWR